MTAEVFSWDDASDNRYLASGVACWVHDAISAYRTTEDTNPDVFKNTYIGMEPAGPGGKRINTCAANVCMVWKFSKNQTAAKEFLTHLVDNDSARACVQSRGYNMPYLNDFAKKPMPVIGTDPKLQILQDFPPIVAFYRLSRTLRHPDPGGRQPVRPARHVHARRARAEHRRRHEVGNGGVPADLREAQEGMTTASLSGGPEPTAPGRRCVSRRPRTLACLVPEPDLAPARVRLSTAGARGALRAAPGRRSLPVLALSRGQRRQRRRARRPLHRARELPVGVGDGYLLDRVPEQRRVPRRGRDLQEPARYVARVPASAGISAARSSSAASSSSRSRCRSPSACWRGSGCTTRSSA